MKNKNINLTGTFKVKSFDTKNKNRLSCIFLVIFSFFFIGLIIWRILVGYDVFLFLIGLVTFLLGILSIASILIEDPVQNTIIVIEKDKITRYGSGLQTAVVPFDKLGSLIHDEMGLYVLKKGFQTKLIFYSTEYRINQEKGIIFIPKSIENYENICFFLEQIQSS
jgi:hypothetical protein